MSDTSKERASAHATTVAQMVSWVDRFAHERDWEKHHAPKNLALSVAIEAAELMEHFQWSDSAENLPLVAEEMADVLSYLLRLSSVLNIDLAAALEAKLAKNALKYPVASPATAD